MKVTEGLVPASILSDPRAARRRVAVLAGIACAGAGLAGMFLRFQDGLLLRLVIASTSAAFAMIVMNVALRAQDPTRAVGRAVGLATVLGIPSTFVPSIILASSDPGPFVAYLIAGVFFGAFTGFAYGIVLGVLAAVAWRDANANTHDGADHATRAAAIWSLGVGLVTTWVTSAYDAHRHLSEWASAADRAAHEVAVPLGVAGSAMTIGAALLLAVAAQRRLLKRHRWLSTIALGADSAWALRPLRAQDDERSLPRLRGGDMVLEHRAGVATYRAPAKVDAVAII